jgi:predicted Zn-dependent protease
MAHEYGQIYCRHVAKGMNRQYGVLVAEAAGGAGGYLMGGADDVQSGASMGSSAGSFINMGFTRGDEAQADETGFHFYHLAGWDPKQFGAFFQAMIDKGYDKTPAYESDHPTLKSRVEKANERVEDLQKAGTLDKYRQPDIASPAEFKTYVARAARLSKTTPDDKSLANSQQLLQSLPRSCVATDPNPPDAQQSRKALLDRANAK